MQQEVPDALILNDIPIELIQPQRDQTNSKNTVNTEDIWHLDAIGLTRARTNGYQNTGKEIKIAVLDTGIDPNHPELLGKVVESHRFKGSEWKVEPQNVSVDSNGHGTHVAGLICGHQIGVAPDVQLINGMTLADPKGRGTLVDLVLALEWVASRSDIQIVNISAGIPQFVEELELLVRSVLAVGILPVCAIGNNGRDITSSPGNCRGVISVGATTRKNQVWGDSSSSQMTVDQHIYSVPSLVAPGHEVYSCVIGGGYEAWNGTSMATPIVSGVAALMLQSEPLISVGDMRETLLRQCQKLSNELNERQGAGIIQV
jgi:subtilisin family serine protease